MAVLVSAQIEAGVTVIRRYGIGGHNLDEIVQAIADAIEANKPPEASQLPTDPNAPTQLPSTPGMGGEHPDQGLPTPPGAHPEHPIAPGGEHPDQGLPGTPPGAAQLPSGGPHPDQGLPEAPPAPGAPTHPVAPPPSASHPIAPPPTPEPRHKR